MTPASERAMRRRQFRHALDAIAWTAATFLTVWWVITFVQFVRSFP